MRTLINPNTYLVTNAKDGDMVWCRSRSFEFEGWGYVQYWGLHETGLSVRLEMDDDHPRMAEAIADSGLDGDQVELIDIVPFEDIEFVRVLSGADYKVQVWTEPVPDHERAQRAKARGFTRLSLPELDAHFDPHGGIA